MNMKMLGLFNYHPESVTLAKAYKDVKGKKETVFLSLYNRDSNGIFYKNSRCMSTEVFRVKDAIHTCDSKNYVILKCWTEK